MKYADMLPAVTAAIARRVDADAAAADAQRDVDRLWLEAREKRFKASADADEALSDLASTRMRVASRLADALTQRLQRRAGHWIRALIRTRRVDRSHGQRALEMVCGDPTSVELSISLADVKTGAIAGPVLIFTFDLRRDIVEQLNGATDSTIAAMEAL